MLVVVLSVASCVIAVFLCLVCSCVVVVSWLLCCYCGIVCQLLLFDVLFVVIVSLCVILFVVRCLWLYCVGLFDPLCCYGLSAFVVLFCVLVDVWCCFLFLFDVFVLLVVVWCVVLCLCFCC